MQSKHMKVQNQILGKILYKIICFIRLFDKITKLLNYW